MDNFEIKINDVGEGVEEEEIVEWNVKVGEIVREEDIIDDVMKEKEKVEIKL